MCVVVVDIVLLCVVCCFDCVGRVCVVCIGLMSAVVVCVGALV